MMIVPRKLRECRKEFILVFGAKLLSEPVCPSLSHSVIQSLTGLNEDLWTGQWTQQSITKSQVK